MNQEDARAQGNGAADQRDPRVAALLARLAAIGGPEDSRPEEDLLDEREALALELARIIVPVRPQSSEGAEDVERLHEAALETPEALGAFLRAIDARRRVLGAVRAPRPAHEHVLARIGARVNHIATGIRSWDEATRGGLLEGHLHVLAAGPDAGKTGLALQSATHAARAGVAVLWMAADEPRQDIENRIGQAHGLALADLESGGEGSLHYLAGVLRDLPQVQIVDALDGITVEDAQEILAAHKRRLGATSSLLIVDSLQTVIGRAHLGPQAPRTELDRVVATCKALRLCARSGPCVLATSETSRATHGRKDGDQVAAIAAGKGASAIEFWALTLWKLSRIGRGEYAGDTRLEPGKNKRGAVEWKRASIRLEHDPDRCTYTDRGRFDAPGAEPSEKGGGPKAPLKTIDLEPYKARVRKTLAGRPRGFAGNREDLATIAGGKMTHTRAAIADMLSSGEIKVEKKRLVLVTASSGTTPAAV
jgi:hypothetical protein